MVIMVVKMVIMVVKTVVMVVKMVTMVVKMTKLPSGKTNQDCKDKDGNNPVTLGLENMRGVRNQQHDIKKSAT